MKTSSIILLLLILTSAACASGRVNNQSPWATANPDWIERMEPFPIYGEVHYVGTRGLSSFLIATPEGHFLIDGGLPENAGAISENIRALGFNIKDVKYLLNSHAHFDHSGGLAALKKMSGGLLVASECDRWALETGLVPGSEEDPEYAAPPVRVDRLISDQESLTHGGVTLTAYLTPGHTKGCTSWKMNSGNKEILFFCSATVANNRLVGSPQYEGIVDDYRSTFARTRSWRPDIFLANHPAFFAMEQKLARRLSGDVDAFVDQDGFPAMMEILETAFEKALAEQMALAQTK